MIDCVICSTLYTIALGIRDTGEPGSALFGGAVLLGIFLTHICFLTQSTSMGKSLLGLRVYNKNTKRPLSFGSMLAREIIGKFISIAVLCIGFLWILIDKDYQGWHDKLIGSVVCHEERF